MFRLFNMAIMKKIVFIIVIIFNVTLMHTMELCQSLQQISNSIFEAFPIDKEKNKKEFNKLLYAHSCIKTATNNIQKYKNYNDACVNMTLALWHLGAYMLDPYVNPFRKEIIKQNKTQLEGIKEIIEDIIYQ